MTLLVSGATLALSLLLGTFYVDLGAASRARIRAQTAADAAALAAVAEAAPFGSGRPEEVAASFARLNGARLIECRCVAATTAAQVTVEVEGATATARATFDPSLLAPAILSFDRRGLHPHLAAAVDALVSATRGGVYPTSGFRSALEQSKLWAEAVARYGGPEAADDWVARPGTSMHERGLAVDLGGDIPSAVRAIETLGLPLYRPLANEPWHFELIGTRR